MEKKEISTSFWLKSFEGLKTDITASKLILPPNDDYKKGWNDAMDKALRFVRLYEKKEGLFQINEE